MPLNDPIGSTALDVLQRNAQDVDRATNQTSGTVTTRLGEQITPFPVLSQQWESAIANTGWFAAAGSFEAGGAITERNQYLQLVTTVGGDVAGGYSWGGALPKTVTVGSTPATSGGIGPNAWVYRGDTILRSELADGSAGISGETAGDIAAAINKSDIRIYGVPSLDVADLIQAALNATGRAYVPEGNWEHKGGTVLLDIYQHIFFAGSQITNTSATYASFIKAANKRDWSVTGSCTYIGTRSNSLDVGAEKFMEVEGGFDYVLSGALTARLCRSHGFHFKDGANSGGTRGQRARISDIAAIGCDVGIETAPASNAEYLAFSNANAWGNRIGIIDGAGNTIFVGGNCVDNTNTGFKLVGNYGNSAHGIVSAMNINHNSVFNLHCENVPNGHTFDACHFYGDGGGTGDIFFDNCKGIIIDGGNIDCYVYNFDGAGSGLNYIRNVFFVGGYGDALLLDESDERPVNLIVTDCFGPGAYIAGVSSNDPSLCYVSAFRGTDDQVSMTSGLQTNLVFPSVESNGDRRGAYNNTTGFFTCPTDQAGQYRVSVNLVFQGASLTAGSSSAEVTTPSKRILVPLSPVGSVLLSGECMFDVYLSSGQTVNCKALIVGTDIVFGSGSYVPIFSVNRIS